VITQADYYLAVYKNLVDHLATRYLSGEAREVADLCDLKLDKSGQLLGEVREAARSKI